MGDLRDFFKKRFSHPLADHLDIDSSGAISIHRKIIRENRLLREHYAFVYRYFKKVEDSLADLEYPSLEIGSGGGFLREYLPGVITSDVMKSDGIDRAEDAGSLSFPDNSLKAVYANGVLHHIKDPAACLYEIQRVLVRGGKFVCNEPSSSLFGYFMNRHFHGEYTDKHAKEWKIEGSDRHGRLTGANMALPYIIFKRDAGLFRLKFKNLEVVSIIYHDFLRYTLSGGLRYRPFAPKLLYGPVNFMEWLTRPLMPALGHNMLVTVQKT